MSKWDGGGDRPGPGGIGREREGRRGQERAARDAIRYRIPPNPRAIAGHGDDVADDAVHSMTGGGLEKGAGRNGMDDVAPAPPRHSTPQK
jgi:hypothetical protein